MRIFQGIVALSAFASCVLAATSARADGLEDLDGVGPVRIGAGYSKIFHSPVTSMSFEDEFTVTTIGTKLGKPARFHVLFGMDGYGADLFRDTPMNKSFLVVNAGAGVSFFLGRPLVAISGALGPGYSGADNGALPDGFGVGGRVEVFPFYRPLQDSIKCRDGWFSTYVLSGLSVWGDAREDFFGANHGSMFAAGVGIDLARNVLLPVMHRIMTGHCGV